MAERSTARVGSVHQSLPEAIVAELRERILDGVLAQGERLVERDLARELEVSRIPLREAILQLESEGLVRRLPRRGAAVASLAPADVADLFDVRESLEALAAGLAAERADERALARMARCLARACEASGTGQASTIADLNLEFHSQIVAAAGNELLSAMIAPLTNRTRWLFRVLTAGDTDTAALCREHTAIYEAIASGNRTEAEQLACAHIASTREPTLALLTESHGGQASLRASSIL